MSLDFGSSSSKDKGKPMDISEKTSATMSDIAKLCFVITKTYQKHGRAVKVDLSKFLTKGDVDCFTREFGARNIASTINIPILKEEIKLRLLANVKKTISKGSITTENNVINGIIGNVYLAMEVSSDLAGNLDDYLNNLLATIDIDLADAIVGTFIASRQGYKSLPPIPENRFEDYFKITDERFKFEDNLIIKRPQMEQMLQILDKESSKIVGNMHNVRESEKENLEIQRLLNERSSLFQKIEEIDARIAALKEKQAGKMPDEPGKPR